jgi:protein SFI1
MAREAAVENWLIAVSFWELHLVRRCFQRWAEHRGEVVGRALEYWMATSVKGYFDRWRMVRGVGRRGSRGLVEAGYAGSAWSYWAGGRAFVNVGEG